MIASNDWCVKKYMHKDCTFVIHHISQNNIIHLFKLSKKNNVPLVSIHGKWSKQFIQHLPDFLSFPSLDHPCDINA